MKYMSIGKYLDEAIKLELNVADLYRIFSLSNIEDEKFWWKISMEEINHASLLKSGLEYVSMGIFPEDMLSDDIEDMIKLNSMFEYIINDYNTNPSRSMAFDIAINLEKSAGESHYQTVMKEETDNPIIDIFKRLNRDDINHLERLEKYRLENNI